MVLRLQSAPVPLLRKAQTRERPGSALQAPPRRLGPAPGTAHHQAAADTHAAGSQRSAALAPPPGPAPSSRPRPGHAPPHPRPRQALSPGLPERCGSGRAWRRRCCKKRTLLRRYVSWLRRFRDRWWMLCALRMDDLGPEGWGRCSTPVRPPPPAPSSLPAGTRTTAPGVQRLAGTPHGWAGHDCDYPAPMRTPVGLQSPGLFPTTFGGLQPVSSPERSLHCRPPHGRSPRTLGIDAYAFTSTSHPCFPTAPVPTPR